MTPPLLFLDVDGVILPFTHTQIPTHTLRHLSTILTAVPDIKMILSSTWRCSPQSVSHLRESFASYGPPLSSFISHLENTTDLGWHTVWCEEIARYLANDTRTHTDTDCLR
eukprot:CAMPEP_0194396542 /NCGR_PEP_ID=MMETSP0174-20130528/125048_1 /TAXON_ID=216777 /ORGANISM="Proboscia alata, Strain PI-D3" /LENGTH=110 /DNA_ID=CAMNT_0039192625 /DNA_START=1135 /DNA_END=1467 /DNA_ORIENTATION=+